MTFKWESLPQWSLSPLRAALWGAGKAEEGGEWAAMSKTAKWVSLPCRSQAFQSHTPTVSLAGEGSVIC